MVFGTVDLNLALVVDLLGTDMGNFLNGKRWFQIMLMTSSIAIARALSCSSTADDGIQITLTDVPSMLPLLEENIALNPTKLALRSVALPWGEPLPTSISARPPDIILAADCCYYEPAFPLLLDTLEDLLRSIPDGCCYFCFKKRRVSASRSLRLCLWAIQ